MASSTTRRVGKDFRRTRFILLVTSLTLVGCGTKEGIRHYKVPKPELVYAENHVESAGGQAGLKYDVPEGWSQQAPVSMSVLTLGLRDGGQAVQITVTPLAGDGGGLLANVNRWYRQLGLPAISEAELADKTEPLEVNGVAGIYLEASSDAAPGGSKAIAGWIGMQPQRSWFVKLSGDPPLVAEQTGVFRDFLKTLKF